MQKPAQREFGRRAAVRALRPLVLLAIAPALLLAGCADRREVAAAEAADEFYSAVAASEGRTACRMLAPRTRTELVSSSGSRCAQAVLEEIAPAISGAAVEPTVVVYGDSARARAVGDTAFLARFPGGWQITAAGCRPRGGQDRPYDCRI